MLLLWQISANLGWIDKFYFSSPSEIGALFVHDIKDKSLLSHIGITLFESGVSFLLIILFSLLIATFFWFYPSLGKLFEPFLIVLNSLPKSALAPLIIVWLGTGLRTIILCGMSVGIFGCILNLYQSFSQTDGEFIAARQGLGYLIIYGSQVFKLDMVILSIAILCAIAMLIYGVLNFIEQKMQID